MTGDLEPDAINRVAYMLMTFTDRNCDDREVCRRLALLNDVTRRPIELLSQLPLVNRLPKE